MSLEKALRAHLPGVDADFERQVAQLCIEIRSHIRLVAKACYDLIDTDPSLYDNAIAELYSRDTHIEMVTNGWERFDPMEKMPRLDTSPEHMMELIPLYQRSKAILDSLCGHEIDTGIIDQIERAFREIEGSRMYHAALKLDPEESTHRTAYVTAVKVYLHAARFSGKKLKELERFLDFDIPEFRLY